MGFVGHRQHRFAQAFAVACVLLSASRSFAQPTQSFDDAPAEQAAPEANPSPKEVARQSYQEGSRLYAEGKYAEAIAAFEKAYEAYPAAALLFNLAQAYRLLGPEHCAEALDYYERYLSEDPNTPDRDQILVHMAEMRGCTRASRPADSEDSQPTATASTTNASPPTTPGVQDTPPPVAGPAPIPVSAYVTGAVGIVGLATFAVFAVLGNNQQSDLETDCSPGCPPDRVDSMKTKFLIADIGLATGLVAIGAATYLVLSRPAADSNLQARAAQLTWVGRF